MTDITIPDNVVKPPYLIDVVQLMQDIDHINGMIECRVDSSNMEELASMIEELSSWLAKATDIQASAKFYSELAFRVEYDRVADLIKKKEIPSELKSLTSPMLLKEYIRSRCATWTSIYERSERTHRSLTHRFEALRTLLSKEKEIFKLTYNQNNNQ